jgi:flagellar protein FlaG
LKRKTGSFAPFPVFFYAWRKAMSMQIQTTETVARSAVLRTNVVRQAQKTAAIERLEESLDGQPETQQQRLTEIRTVAVQLEQVSHAFNKKLKFEVDHQSHEVIVKVIDPTTDKVVKVLPPEELRRLHDQIREMIGLMFDEHD